MGWLEKGVRYIYIDIYILIWSLNEDFFSREYFIKINIIFLNGNFSAQKFYFKNLTENTTRNHVVCN
jgi:hypothetical protein